jgi:hypothetical protein
MRTLFTAFLSLCFSFQIYAQCNSFFPLKENVRYEYEMFDKKEKMTARMTHTMKNISGSEDNMKATLAQEIFDGKKGDKISVSELDWTCQNGTLHFDMKSMNLMMDNTQQMNMAEGGMSIDVTGDELDLPSELEVGQTLRDVSYTIKITMGTLPLINRTFTVKDRKVESRENLTTPAGTFDCYKVTFTTTDEKGRSQKSSIWYAKDAGMIKNENYNDDGKLINSQVLVKVVK